MTSFEFAFAVHDILRLFIGSCLASFALADVSAQTLQVPLSERVKRVTAFERELEELAGSVGQRVPSSVEIDYPLDAQAISQEALALRKKFGETMEFYQLMYTLQGVRHGKWTCLSLTAKDGNMCDDSSVRYPGPYNSTVVWEHAPAVRHLLQPIEFALRRVRYSVIHPATMVSWHCDDCPKAQMSPPGCQGHQDFQRLREKWNTRRFHRWVRLHLMLSNTNDIEMGIGAHKARGTSKGHFYLANVAMPHRVDNKGNSVRTALLVDVRIAGQTKKLRQSSLGRSILKAVRSVRAADGSETYLRMGQSFYKYLCGPGFRYLSDPDRFEAEWYSRAWSTPLWAPLPPFQPRMFNSRDRCGVLGPPTNREWLEAMMLQSSLMQDGGSNSRETLSRPSRQLSRPQRRRRSDAGETSNRRTRSRRRRARRRLPGMV